MTTPRDLMIIALDVAPERPVGRGDLALALAGAELLDLLADRTATLADDRIVPESGHRPPAADPLLEAAAAALVREAPYESVADWLWRRGQDLPSAYLAALEAEGQLVRQRRRGQPTLADSPDRRRAADRWTAAEPVLASLAEAVGIGTAEEPPAVPDDTTATVLAAVNDALMELEAVRQRRAIEDAAFDNIWRGN
ncbi:GPP34 family phosphoprotein [Streptomyces goshikiensis]|uniref:GPP34 family phosphoprotein n=1 Tax=Streptomyces goshikiensis TaxID=1942 RepID=A0ABZ1RIW0_9ACTN|nr:GPP34 family phosphoprotein [Streptomyces goshikiensis]